MSLALVDIVKQLSPKEMDFVTEQALADGPFSVEAIDWDEEKQSKLVTVQFKTGRKQVIQVPIWQTNSH